MGALFLSEHKKNKIEKMIPLVLLIATTLVSAAPQPYYYQSYVPLGYGYGYGYGFRPSFTSFNPRLIRPTSFKTKTSFRTDLASTTDIIMQTRILSNSVQQTLRDLAANPSSAVIVNKIIYDKDNVCLKDLDEALRPVGQSSGSQPPPS